MLNAMISAIDSKIIQNFLIFFLLFYGFFIDLSGHVFEKIILLINEILRFCCPLP
jgi:hypothetical protein